MTGTHPAETNTLVAVVGMSVLTPLADSPAVLAQALCEGRRSIQSSSEIPGIGESRMVDFDATRYAAVRGMRVYNRTTRLAICAAKLALVDAGLEGAGSPPEELGLVAAFTSGHMDTALAYDRSLVTEGLQRTNPTLMPLALLSAPGAAIALSFGAKAFSVTVSDGAASSLDALGLGTRLLQAGRARACLVVGSSSLCRELLLSASRAQLLSSAEDFKVFDRRSQGTVFGEAAAAFVLEPVSDARRRGVEPKGFVHGQASMFARDPSGIEQALRRACHRTLGAARVDAAGLGLVSAGASGLPEYDRAEARALLAVLGGSAARTPVVATKAYLGETVDASGLVQCVAALAALRSKTAPPMPGLDEPEVAGLCYPERSVPVHGRHALVTSISSTGACSALVLSANS